MSRKQPKRRAGNLVFVTMAGIFIVATVSGVGFGVASANSADDVARSNAFGYDETTTQTTSDTQSSSYASEQVMVYYEQSALASTSPRTLDSGMKLVDTLEKEAKERAVREDAEAIDRVEAQKAMQGTESMVTNPEAANESSDSGMKGPTGFTAEERLEYSLPPVDWTVGKEAFIAEWTERIDKYLKGSNLEGYGKVFAEAAWQNGVDPRWSPAISNTESGKGAVCFASHNAWGWGSSAWGDWESAIRDHVAGLAEVYGYSITYEAAGIYCPPNQDHWYRTTITEMATI